MNSPASGQAEKTPGRKSILFITPRFGTVNRGVEVFVEQICRRLDRRKFAVSILSAPHEVDMRGVEFLKHRTVPRECLGRLHQNRLARFFFRTPWFRGPAELESLFLMLNSAPSLFRRPFDIVVPQGGSWTYLFANLLFPRTTRIVSIGHAGPVKSDLGRSHLFVALTPAMENKALEMCPHVKTRVIPNGVDCEMFKPGERPRHSGTRTILTVGALARDKRHDLLLDAAAQLEDDIKVVIVGDGPEKSRLMQHPLCQTGRVEFRRCTHDQMPACYREADIFSLASPDEAFGLVFLEAMASGLNIVAHNGASQRFVLGNAAIFCNVLDRNAYASSLNRALAMERTEASVVRARKFDWTDVAARYETAFSEV